MMHRREFVKFLALLAVGQAATPEQLGAFERYYDLNSPRQMPLVAIDEIFLSGQATVSTPVRITVGYGPLNELHLGLNAYGGIVRWCAMPDQRIVIAPSDFRWKIEFPGKYMIDDAVEMIDDDIDSPARGKYVFDHQGQMYKITGHISYIDGNGIRQTKALVDAEGSLLT